MADLHPKIASPSPVLRSIWVSALAVAAAAVLWPAPASAPAANFGSLGGYPAEVATNLYRLIRIAMPWLPAGVLLALVMSARTIRLGALVVIGACLVLVWAAAPEAGGGSLARDLLFVIPGLAVGVWLADRTKPGDLLASAADQATSHPNPAGRSSASLPLPSMAEGRGPGLDERAPTADRTLLAQVAWRVLGAALVVAALLLAVGLPRWGPPLALGLSLYAALLWRWPQACLVVVPAALPLLDLAPWTGRILLDEFDLLVVITVGALLLGPHSGRGAPVGRFGAALITGFLLSAVVCGLVGLFPLPPLDANAISSAISSYWSPFNALRVGKGFAWGAALFWMLRRAAPDERLRTRLLGLGMAAGLLGVGLIGVWERWLFAGLGDAASTYRIVSTFSSMHTGGGHIEAYLVAAVPFLWLGLFRWRSLVFVGPVLLLSAYVMLYTVARGGVLAFVVIAAILATATLRRAWSGGLQRAALPMGAIAVVLAVVLAGAVAGGGYLMQRFERSAEDWNIRTQHWRLALRMVDAGGSSALVGAGLGTFPRAYLTLGPTDRQPATFAIVADAGDAFLRMGVGQTLYLAQRVPVSAGTRYHLSLALRSRGTDGALAAPLCEKQLLDSRRCDWFQAVVPGDGRWHTLSHDFAPATVGAGPAWEHLPVELYFHNPGTSGVVDIDRVSLTDPNGRELIHNGDFAQGSDFWFFKTQSHLPWHIKNFWVHTYFEMGWLGLLATAALVLVAVSRLARAGWRGSPLAWALLASIAGLLTVGLFDSLIDAPRLATLLIAWLFIGASWPNLPNRPH